ncbi:MAG: ABC transporter permease [Bryobacteraceae bacterium]|nr:ABC transporter permease [Bryobacteraceae bacterium]
MSWRRIREIIRKELRQTLREPRMRVFLFVPPLVQLLIFGYAVNLDVEDSRVAWVDQDRTGASRDLRAELDGSPYIRITHTPSTPAEAQRLLDRGEVSAVVAVLPGFARTIDRGDTAPVQVLVDGSNSNTASVVSSYVTRVVANFSAARMLERQRSLQMALLAAAGVDGPRYAALPSLNANVRVWFNPDLKSRNYFVPGVVVNIITLVTLMLTAMAIVREKEIGTMEQLMVTPVRPIELMLGKTLPFAAVGLAQLFLITGAALLVFRVPLRGSPLLLVVCAALYLMTTLGAGLFMSTISRTQQQALMGSFFFFMPAFMLSGFAFPIRNMPLPIQYLTYVNPVRYFMEVVRGLFLKGVGVETLWPQMLSMAVFGAAVLAVSALRFHKRLD